MLRRTLPVGLLFLLAATGLTACSDDDLTLPQSSTYALTLTGSGYAPHANQTLRFSVVNTATSAEVARFSAVVATDGTFATTQPGVLTDGGTYRVDYFADGGTTGSDSAENGQCDAAGVDHAWRLGISGTGGAINGTPAAVSGDVTVALTHSGANQTDTCATFADLPAPYDFTYVATDYTGPHGTQTLYMALVKTATGRVVSTVSQALPASGSYSRSFPGVLIAGNTYQFDYFVDGGVGGAGNGVCDFPADHQWRVALVDADSNGANDISNPIAGGGTPGPVTGAITLTNAHGTAFTDVCVSFP